MACLKPLLILVLVVSPALTDTKKDDLTRVFAASYDKVWDACIASANGNFVVDHSEKESGVLTFHSGISFTSAGFTVGVTLKKLTDDTVQVRLNPQAKGLGNWGAGVRIAKKFFKGVESELKKSN